MTNLAAHVVERKITTFIIQKHFRYIDFVTLTETELHRKKCCDNSRNTHLGAMICNDLRIQ